jgi:glycosyltransferase involved in cell wall biosynthesis
MVMVDEPLQDSPLVSVLLPTYNAGLYLRQALNSILAQSFERLEIIIIDDGSTDGCIDTILDIVDSRVQILRQSNSGKATALNNALEFISGDFWMIQDADDLSHPDRVKNQLHELIENPDLAAVYTGHNLLVDQVPFAPSFSSMGRELCRTEIWNFRIPAHDATGMYRTRLVEKFRFDPELRIGQGVDFVLRIGENFPITLLGKCLYTYRINYQSTIRKEPEKNILWINKVKSKAYERRKGGGKVKLVDANVYKTKKRGANNHIVSHCIKSIVDFKNQGSLADSLWVGLQCVKLSPCDAYFYKPILYSMIPICFIEIYKKFKALLNVM